MTIGLTEETRDLRDAVRGWAGRHITDEVLTAAGVAETEQLPAFWPDLAAQGLLALSIPEAHGGMGASLVEAAVAVEELGRAMVPGPYTPTVIAGAILTDAGHTAHLEALGEGALPAAVGIDPGGLTGEYDGDDLVLTGRPDAVIGAATAQLLILPARVGGETVWAVVAADQVQVTEVVSHDVVRRLARVDLDGVRIPAADVLAVADAHRPVDIAATLLAAEASGMADWAVATSAEYAQVRRQFGRPIGQFQGVKHRIAWMLAKAEQGRACAWDAARALSPATEDAPAVPADEAALAAAVAAAVTLQAAFDVAKDNIDNLGGIGFTWEHHAHLYLRRAQTSIIVLGGTARWRRRIAELTLGGTRRALGVELPEEADEIRARIGAELDEVAALPEDQRTGRLAELGYTAPHYPEPWGKGADAVTQLVIDEELAARGLTPHDMVIGNWVVPTIIAHGSQAQQEQYIPGSLRGDIVWCQLFSEPGAGSDLASLTTKAVKVDGGWVISGQKVWTSMARQADYGILLARTDPDSVRHRGISYFLLDMKAENLDIRPLREITGDELFNEVFLDEVFVPDEALVAEPGDGWKLARTTLANERVNMARGSSLGGGGEKLLETAERLVAERGEDGLDAEMRTTLGQVLADAQSGGLLALRGTIRSLAGDQPGAESSIAKLIGVNHRQQVWEVIMDWTGTESLIGEHSRGDATWWFLSTRNLSIAGGTTDVQLNIVGERILGLPRDPAPGK